ncbi:MAG: serine/threonine protein kinase, partial [Oscillospiraceae bacterium]|nr:serine/threonine protein kinase [Oscillospiraceae bacterium]
MGTRCFGCMRIKENKPICEHCGYDECRENGNHQLPVGTVVGEQYVLGRVLGQGGFGITYIGYDMTMGQTVAVKEYFPSGYAGRDPRKMTRVISYDNTDQNTFASNKRRFLREAESMGKLWNIPQIVKVLRHFEENGTAYIAMEYVEGMDLRMYMKQLGRPMTMEEVYRILGPVIQALDHVHGADLVHRDISPDNIMVMPDGTAKLLDFGAARYVENADAQKDRNTSTQTILKHGFAPPEQYRSHGALGPWTDIYAICATVYYCLTGRIPPEAMNRMMGEGELNWKGIAGLTPSQIKTLEQGMALMPANRIKTARELYQALFADMIANRDRAAQAEKDRLAREERLREARERQSREAEPKAAAKPAKGKNRKKKPFRGIIGFAVLCALIAGLFFLPRVTPFFLKQKITVSNATYTLERNESGITITGYQGALPRDLSIPEEVYGIPVTAIRAGAFA